MMMQLQIERRLVGSEIKVETVGETIKLDLAGREEPLGGLGPEGVHGQAGSGGGDGFAVESGQVTGQVAGQQLGLVVRPVVGVDEGRLLRGVVIVGIVVLLNLALGVVDNGGIGSGLTAGGDVITAQDPEPRKSSQD